MKKKFRVVIIADRGKGEYIAKVMRLAFGRENVMESPRPEDLYGMVKLLNPTTVILSPFLFYRHNLQAEDINAFRKRWKFRVLTLYETEDALKYREFYKDLKPAKEYVAPTEYLTMALEIPKLCTTVYQPRKRPLQAKTQESIHRILENCGFHLNMKGAEFLQHALLRMYFDPSLHNNGGAATLYREIAEKKNTTPRIVQRSIQRFLETSLTAKSEEELRKALKIPDFYNFSPVNFGHFTQLFNTYFTILHGDPAQILKQPKKREIN